MRKLPLVIMIYLITFPTPAISLDDKHSMKGLTAVKAIFDVRTSEEKTLQFIFKVIRDTYDETLQQGVRPTYIASMRGPTIKLLVRSRQADKNLKLTTEKLIKELIERNIRLEACGYAIDLFGLEPEDIYKEIAPIGNSLNSIIGYQAKDYALVPMN